MEQENNNLAAFDKAVTKSFELTWAELRASDISRVRHSLYLMREGFKGNEPAKRIMELIKLYIEGAEEEIKGTLFMVEIFEDFFIPVIDTFLAYLSERPYKIGLWGVLLTELIKFDPNDNEEGKSRKNIGKLIGELSRAKDKSDDAKALTVMSNDWSIVEQVTKKQLEIHSTEPSYYLFFAFTLRQTAIIHIPEFLSYYQAKHEGGDYFLFLRGVLNENEDLFSKSQIKTVKEWVKKYKNKQIIEITNNVVEEIPIIGFDPILGRLNKEKFATFLTFLCNENNGDTEPFLSKEIVKKLIENGLVLPKEGNEVTKYEIKDTAKKTLKTVYHCFYKLYDSHSNNRFCKEQIALYLKANFSNFDKLEVDSLKNSLKSVKPPSMTFEISKYLP